MPQQQDDLQRRFEQARQLRLQRQQVEDDRLQRFEAARGQRGGQPQGEEEPGTLGSGIMESFMRTQPVQNPVTLVQDMAQLDPMDFLKGTLSSQASTLASGLRAAFDPREIINDPTGSMARLANIPAGLVPVFGPMASQEVIEPAAGSVSMREPEGATREELLGNAIGGVAGFGVSALADRGVGRITSSALSRARAIQADRAAGRMLSMGQMPEASGFTRFAESMVSRFPGGRGVMERFQNAAQVNLVENGVNRILGSMATFRGTRLQLTHMIQGSVDKVIDSVRLSNRSKYKAFDQALEGHHQPLAPRGAPNRAQRARGIGGDEVTAVVPASQPGAGIPTTPSGVKVVSFAGDAISDIAEPLLMQVGAEQLLVADPSLRGLVAKVEGLAKLRGRSIPVTVATDARSTLLALARRLDNPLGSKETRLINQIFDPIDEAIEATLREVGDTPLVEQWRTANSGVRKLHDLVDDTLFEKIVTMRDPEKMAAAVEGAAAIDLARLQGRLPAEQWNQLRTLLVRDKIASGAVKGELPTVARGGAAPGGAGNPLAVAVDEGSRPVTGAANSINETLNSMDEAIRGILFTDDDLAAWAKLQETASMVGNTGEEIGKLVGSGIAAGTMIGAAGAVGGALLGFGATVGGVGLPLAALGGLTLGSKGVAWILTHPELMNKMRAGIAGAGRGMVTSTFIGRQVVNQLPPEVIQEIIEVNNLPPEAIRPELLQGLGPLAPTPPQPPRGSGE